MLIPYLDRNPHGEGYWFHRSRYLAIFLYTLFMTWQGILIVIGTYFPRSQLGMDLAMDRNIIARH